MNLEQITKMTGGPIFEPPKKGNKNTMIYIITGGVLIYTIWKTINYQKKILMKVNSLSEKDVKQTDTEKIDESK